MVYFSSKNLLQSVCGGFKRSGIIKRKSEEIRGHADLIYITMCYGSHNAWRTKTKTPAKTAEEIKEEERQNTANESVERDKNPVLVDAQAFAFRREREVVKEKR